MLKRFAYLFCLFLFTFTVYSQEQSKLNKLVNVFVDDYNSGNYDDFYHHFSTSLQSKISLNTFETFLKEMKQNLGAIVNIVLKL